MARPVRWLSIAAWALVLELAAVVVYLQVSQQQLFVDYQMNSDGLLAISFVRDIAHHDYAWRGFQLPRIPSLFPDLLLQAAAAAVTPSDRWAIAIYNLVQFQLFVLAGGYLGRLLSGASFLASTTVSLAAISAVVLVDMLNPAPTGLTSFYFQSCLHFGPCIVCLFATGVACRLVERWRWIDAILLFALACLAILSDQLMLVAFVFPVSVAAVAASWLVWRRPPARAWGVVGLLAASAVLALVLDGLLNRQAAIPVDFTQASARAMKFLDEISIYSQAHLVSFFICVGLPMLAFLLYLPLARRPIHDDGLEIIGETSGAARRWPRSPLRGLELDLPTLFLWMTGALAMLAVSAATALMVYQDVTSYRYLVPVFVWPIIFCIAALSAILPTRAAVYVLGAGVALTMTAGFAGAKNAAPGPVAWRSNAAECVMAQKRNLGLKAGIAEYWTARPTAIASQGALQVVQAASNGRTLIWGNDPYDYVRDDRTPSSPPAYNFILMTNMDPAAVRGRYGEPSRIHNCADQGPMIWVYDDAARMTRTFLADLQPPPGSFRQTCTDAILANSDLLARCAGPDHRRRYSRIAAIDQCSGDISNRDGSLKADCRRPPPAVVSILRDGLSALAH